MGGFKISEHFKMISFIDERVKKYGVDYICCLIGDEELQRRMVLQNVKQFPVPILQQSELVTNTLLNKEKF
eukprot:UN34738